MEHMSYIYYDSKLFFTMAYPLDDTMVIHYEYLFKFMELPPNIMKSNENPMKYKEK